MTARLYTIALSHPGLAARGMLEQAGVAVDEVLLPGGLHPMVLKARGFPGVTVPAVRFEDGRRVQGSRLIAQALHAEHPRAGLFPADAAEQREVEEAERWGEEVLQPIPRRIIRRRLRDHLAVRQWFADVASPFPAPKVVGALLTPAVSAFVAQAGATPQRVQADLDALPAHLDHVDALIARGVIGNETPTAADWQIATTVRVVLAFEDLTHLVAGRPAEALARRLVPDYPAIPAP